MTQHEPEQRSAPPGRMSADPTGMRIVAAGPGVIAVIGELDLASGPVLVAAVAGTGAHDVDLSGVTFIDVAGMRALTAVEGLRLVRRAPVVDRLLRLCGIDPCERPGHGEVDTAPG